MEILSYKELNKGTLVGTFNVKLNKMGTFLLREMTLFEKNGKRWIGFPSRSYEVDGQKKFFSYAGFEQRNEMDAFQTEILKILDDFLKKKTETKVEYNDGLPF